ncbi:condensation domain-containing protein, partial [Oleiphilus sp. HI0086]|uniref:condensation domain-containing protein n=1 Tax=Oleiphilus sp. HI0086 TaxID=1822260 RepID=UPI000A52DA09
MTSQIKTIQSVSVDFDPFADQKPTLIKSVPSTAAQLEIWSSVLMDPKASSAFNESFTLKFKGELRVPALINALELTVARHDALRASFSEDGTSFRVFDYQEIQCGLENIEKQALEELIESEAREPLDLVNGPLFRVRLLKESDTCHYLIFTAHHIICDGWSLGIVIADLSAFYNSTVKGNSADLEEAYSFVDFAGQSSENEDKQYWLDKFSKRIPDYELILDKDRPKNRTFNARRIDVDVDLDLITEIKKSAASIGCSLSAYTMAIYFIALQRWTGESFLAVGMPTAAQPGIAPNSLIGHCVSTVPIVSELNPSISVAQAIHEISEEILDAFEHQNFTFGELIRELPIARDPSRIPLLPLLYNFDTGLEDEHLDFHELKCSFHSNPRFYENFEQFMNVADYGDHFTIECQYNTDLFLEESIKARIDEYIWLLTQCSFNLNQSLSELELSPINDYEYLLTRSLGTHHFWHEEQANAPRTVGHYLHHQAQQFAEKEAVIFEQEVLSYRQLDELSSQWAQLLLEEHVSVGDRVGLCLDRSQHMLAALIGILKVGASYVPLDPDFPDDRLAYMIEDSGLQHLVTQETHIKRLPSVAHILNTDLISERLSQQNTACPDVTIPEDTAAYIIYTSGSTGKPK